MATAFDILGLVFGIVGFLGSIPVFLAIVLSQLPSQKLKELDEVLVETEAMWRSILEAGLFAGKPFKEKTTQKLSSLRCRADNLRLQAHCAASIFQEIRAMFGGLSWNISYVCLGVKRLRANISSSTAEEKKRMEIETTIAQDRRKAAPTQSEIPTAAEASNILNGEQSEPCQYPEAHDAYKLSLALSSIIDCHASNSAHCNDNRLWDDIDHMHIYDAPDNTSTVVGDVSCSGDAPDPCTTESRGTSTCQYEIGSAAMLVVCDSITTNLALYGEKSKIATLPYAASIPHAEGSDGNNSLSDRSFDIDASDGRSTISSTKPTSPSVLVFPPRFDNAVGCPAHTPSSSGSGEQVAADSSLSNVALLRQFRQVEREVFARGLGSHILTVHTRVTPRKKGSSSRFFHQSCWAGSGVDARVVSCEMVDQDVEAYWVDCCDNEGTICTDVQDVSELV
ncbi:hypothetical protein BKA93DRAFT_788346 [Sparassis latifolia]